MSFAGLFTACDKSASPTIEGYWNIVSDSSITQGGNTSYNVYLGNNGDYFAFKNGILYTKEASQLDTFKYKLSSANTITLTQAEVNFNGTSETGSYIFAGSNVRIDITPAVTNPGFSFRRIINLKR
jgi:hypothetical protein